MDIAAELAARDMSINVYIRAESVSISIVDRALGGGSVVAYGKLPAPANFDAIEAEIVRLLEGCDE